MDKLRAYEVFCSTAETLSFSRAARRLGTSKAVVSKDPGNPRRVRGAERPRPRLR